MSDYIMFKQTRKQNDQISAKLIQLIEDAQKISSPDEMIEFFDMY